jgi:hypothetical protein
VFVLIRFFFDLLLHRRTPDELPASRFLFWGLIVCSALIDFSSMLVDLRPVASAVVTVVASALDLAFVWCVLHAFGRDRRFSQTLTALLGTSIVFDVLLTPLTFLYRSLDAEQPEAVLVWIILLACALWVVDVAGFILARALERPYALGAAIMLGYVLLRANFVRSLIPVIA